VTYAYNNMEIDFILINKKDLIVISELSKYVILAFLYVWIHILTLETWYSWFLLVVLHKTQFLEDQHNLTTKYQQGVSRKPDGSNSALIKTTQKVSTSPGATVSGTFCQTQYFFYRIIIELLMNHFPPAITLKIFPLCNS
jgi:hypothetical protein